MMKSIFPVVSVANSTAPAQLKFPVYLDSQVQRTLVSLAKAKGQDFSAFVNELLKKDIELIQLNR
jgi:hypothetical protein